MKRNTRAIKNLKVRARRAKNGQYPLLRGLSQEEVQKLMDRPGKYEVVVCLGERSLKYNSD